MWILGFSGGPDPVHPPRHTADDYRLVPSPYVFHDAAAVLLKDGEVVAAIEEERLDRIKHSTRFPAAAIDFCLRSAGISLQQVERLAFYSQERAMDWLVGTYMLQNPWLQPVWSGRALMVELFRRHFPTDPVAPQRLAFIDHHTAHAMSASAMAPFDKSLVLTLDGQGNGLSGTVSIGEGRRLELLAELPVASSIGDLYSNAISFLGYRQFDEYKVMGLAPYGDPQRFRHLFRNLYTLHADGRYTLHQARVADLMAAGLPRRHGEPFTQVHQDLAAALQEAVEEIVLHHVAHYQKATGLKQLSLAGGLAHNCTLNGKLLRSGLFDDVFVQPAAHDAGCALGAALCVYQELAPEGGNERLTHLYWGSEIGDDGAIAAELQRWSALLDFRRLTDKHATTARLMADGAVVGWAQGRSEFGPRALGNRSILADPRPAENKDLINAMVKKREGYRPFAPAVLEEEAHRYFDVPPGLALPYMIFVVPVREEVRAQLGAITHVDGTARIQTVSRQTNPDFWQLIDAFGALTGVPILLNTSFNNHREPIVDSVEDAVVCFLTTGLSYLVVGDFLVEKKAAPPAALLDLVPSFPAHVLLQRIRQHVPPGGLSDLYACVNTAFKEPPRQISATLHEVLSRADGERPLHALLAAAGVAGEEASAALAEEVRELWSQRLVTLRPAAARS